MKAGKEAVYLDVNSQTARFVFHEYNAAFLRSNRRDMHILRDKSSHALSENTSEITIVLAH